MVWLFSFEYKGLISVLTDAVFGPYWPTLRVIAGYRGLLRASLMPKTSKRFDALTFQHLKKYPFPDIRKMIAIKIGLRSRYQ